MKKSVAIKWVEALRSGKYVQGTRALRSPTNQFCCLGVLCEVVKIKAFYDIAHAHNYIYSNCDLVLPEVAQRKAGIKSSRGSIPVLDTTLVELNDGPNCLTFDEIADIIQIFYKDL